jgi:Flp pilus assembly protein TadD
MRLITTVFAAALAASITACSPQSEPEPANEGVAAAMPETPDRSETAADEQAVRDAAAGGAAPATEPAGSEATPSGGPAG